MWVAAVFVCYLLLAFSIPVLWASAHVWRRARIQREVRCPEFDSTALLNLDPWYAVRRNAIGEQGLRVHRCSRWDDQTGCGQECLVQIAAV